MGDEDGHPGRMLQQSVGHLLRGQHQAARRVQDDIYGYGIIRHLDGPDDLLRILDVDVAHEGKAEEAQGLLTVYESDDPAAAFSLDPAQGIEPLALKTPALDQG